MFLGRVDVLGSIHLYIKVYNPRIKKSKKSLHNRILFVPLQKKNGREMKDPTFEVMFTCPICGGVGYLTDEDGEHECGMCSGSGEVEKDNPEYKEWLYDHYGF